MSCVIDITFCQYGWLKPKWRDTVLENIDAYIQETLLMPEGLIISSYWQD